jgi:hypothetical protein
MGRLSCALVLTPIGDAVAIAFRIGNPSERPVSLQHPIPFLNFELRAESDDGPIPIVQAAYDTGIAPREQVIPPHGEVRIDTPIRLRFDPNIAPSGGNDRRQWTLVAAPVPVRITARVRLVAETLECQESWAPEHSQS